MIRKGLTRKIYLEMTPPSEADNRSYAERILAAIAASRMVSGKIEDIDYNMIEAEDNGDWATKIVFATSVLRRLYPLCDEADWKVTVSLAYTGTSWEIVRLEKGDTSADHYGLAADLGSTTVVMQLVNCNTGEVLGQESVYNHQIKYGEDILSRIFYCKGDAEKIEEIRQLTVSSFVECMDALKESTGIDPREAISMVMAGNTTMTHFFLGLDAFCVFQTPYAVRTLTPGFFKASDLDIPVLGYVYCYPSKANYLGGDIISGMIATRVYEKEEMTLFFDVGTNGELVIGNNNFLICGAGAAGPALEGGSVRTGMRAAKGAVQGVKLENGIFTLDVIGYDNPIVFAGAEGEGSAASVIKGICGSGIVDLLSELFMNGWIDIRGKFVPDKSPLIRWIVDDENYPSQYAVEYAPGLCFFQNDVEEFVCTKAAAFTMIDYLLSESGMTLDDIAGFYMAGAFGTHINKEAAVNIGMYPDVPYEKIHRAGNSSLEGTRMLLLDRMILKQLDEILELMTYVQFGSLDGFLNRMGAAQALPHTNIQIYPSVIKRLKEHGIIC